MGMIAYIYKNGTDCSNHGASSRVDRVTITNVDGPFNPTDDAPAAKLVKGNLTGTVKIVMEENEGQQIMFGGCYVATSDSRFNRKIEEITGPPFYGAVPLHDRVE